MSLALLALLSCVSFAQMLKLCCSAVPVPESCYSPVGHHPAHNPKQQLVDIVQGSRDPCEGDCPALSVAKNTLGHNGL